MVVRELINKIGFKLDETSLNNVQKKMDRFGKRLVDIGTKYTLAITTPIVAFTTFATRAAIDAEETLSKFNTVFENVLDQANMASRSLVENYGLARNESKKLLSDTGDLLVGFGFTESAALDLSRQVQELAVDLASFTNIQGGSERASAALSKALLGERESVKALGIAILEEDVKRQVALNRTRGLTFASERQAKAVATLQLAQQQSTKAIGDYNRTQNSTANRLRRLQKVWKDFQITLGRSILQWGNLGDLLGKVIVFIQRLEKWWENLSKRQKDLILTFTAITAAIGPLLIGLGLLLKFVGGPILLIIAGIAAIGVAFLLVLDSFQTWREGGESALAGFFEAIENFYLETKKVLDRIIQDFKDFGEAVKNMFIALNEFIKGLFGIDLIDFFSNTLSSLKKTVKTNLDVIKKVIKETFISLVPGLRPLLEIINFFRKSEEGVISKNLVDRSKQLAENAKQIGQNIREGVSNTVGNLLTSVGQQGLTVATGLPGVTGSSITGMSGTNRLNNVSLNTNVNITANSNVSQSQINSIERSIRRGQENIGEQLKEALINNGVVE